MGLLQLFFGKKEERSEMLELCVDDLRGWVDGQINYFMQREEMGMRVEGIWAKGRLHKKNIAELVKVIEKKMYALQGSVQEEVMGVLGLVKRVESMLPEMQRGVNELGAFLIVFDSALMILIRKMDKTEFVSDAHWLLDEVESLGEELLEDEGDEVHPLLEQITMLQLWQREAEQFLAESGYQTLAKLQEKSVVLQESLGNAQKLRQRWQEKKERLQFAVQKKEEKEKEVELLKADPSYEGLQEVYGQREALVVKLEELQDCVYLFFSKIKPILKRYAQQYDGNGLVLGYLDDPVKGFVEDENVGIMHVLDHIHTGILQERFLFPTEEVNVFLGYGEKIHNGFLREKHRDLSQVKRELEMLESSMRNRYFLFKVQEAHYRVEHFAAQIKKLEEEFAQVEEEMNLAVQRFEREKQLFCELAKVSLGKNVVVR